VRKEASMTELDIERRITRFLDQLQDPGLSDEQIVRIQSKIRFLKELQKEE